MKPALIDTNILSFFFRNHSLVIERFQDYLKEYDKINISIITYYEIISGLKHRDARKRLDDIDILIAGIAIANDLIIVTNNIRDFGKIENLEVQDWSK